MNCKECKYFERNTEKWKNNKYGECNCDKFLYNECLNEEEKERVKNNDMLLYTDYEGYLATFEVGENFGCIHFKSKE